MCIYALETMFYAIAESWQACKGRYRTEISLS